MIQIYFKNPSNPTFSKASLKAQQEVEKYQNLKAILNLLSSFEKFSSLLSSNLRHDAFIAFFQGLDLLFDTLNLDALTFPKLNDKFFLLLRDICQDFSDELSVIPPSSFHKLLSSLKLGITRDTSKIIRASLFAIECLAKSHFSGQTLNKQLEAAPNIFNNLFKWTFDAILENTSSLDMIDQFASTIFTCICAHKPSFMAFANSMIQSAKTENQAKLTNFFKALLEGLQPVVNESTISDFYNNLSLFLVNYKSLV